jgi:hypothetical protein
MSISMHKAFLKATEKEGTQIVERIHFIEKRLDEIEADLKKYSSNCGRVLLKVDILETIYEKVQLIAELTHLRNECDRVVDELMNCQQKIQQLES